MGVRFPTLEDITTEIVESMIGPGGRLEDLPNQHISRMFVLAIRDAAYNNVMTAKAVYEAQSPITAKGSDLDQHCLDNSATVRRREERTAKIRFALSKTRPVPFETPIPKGSLVLQRAQGSVPSLDFHTLEASVIPSGQTEVEVVAICALAGAVGNLAVGAGVLPGMAGVDTARVISIEEEGVDRESDASLLERFYVEARSLEKGGTGPDYEIWARRIAGVVSAKAINCARGNGTVDVIITGAAGLPTQTLIDEVQAYINQKTPAGGADVSVRAPNPIYVDVKATVEFEYGHSSEAILPYLEEAIRATIASENKVYLVRKSKLSDAINDTAGVFNYNLVAPAQDVPLDSGDLALPGNIEVTFNG